MPASKRNTLVTSLDHSITRSLDHSCHFVHSPPFTFTSSLFHLFTARDPNHVEHFTTIHPIHSTADQRFLFLRKLTLIPQLDAARSFGQSLERLQPVFVPPGVGHDNHLAGAGVSHQLL